MGTAPSTLRSVCLWTLAFIPSLFLFITGIPIALLSPREGHVFLRAWSKLMLRIFSVEVEVIDRNNGKYEEAGILYVTLNQTSLAEGFIGTSAIPTPYRLIMSLQMALFPVIGWFYWAMGGVVLFPFWKTQSKRALDKAAHQLEGRANFWLSIEGKRSRNGSLSPYKKGGPVMSIKAGAKIVPIVYHGAREILPYGEWKIRPGRVQVVLCRAIPTRGLVHDDRDRLLEMLQEVARTELGQAVPQQAV